MDEYLNLVSDTLATGTYKPNRTAVDTISNFGYSYSIDLSNGFPLLTTKDLSGSRWESLVHEFLWYLSGDPDISELKEETSIWDTWADENDMLETAYGRFWRQYPTSSDSQQFTGENWVDSSDSWVNSDGTVDQLEYVSELLESNPFSRRMVVTAWHPANASTSLLPPCHFTFVCNVQGDDTLNVHLTQRSGDIALGVPFNIASYSLLAQVLANQSGYKLGEFSHTVVDAHIYCGDNERGEWYQDELSAISEFVQNSSYYEAEQYIQENAPEEEIEYSDHIPQLLKQLQRDVREQPQLSISDEATIDSLSREDIVLSEYNPHPSLQFYVAG